MACKNRFPDNTFNFLRFRRISGSNKDVSDLPITTKCSIQLFLTAPSGLAVAATVPEQLDLSWTDNSDTETGFQIYRSTTSGSGFSLIATTAADATSYEDTGLAHNTVYYYKVRAIGDTLNSNFTSEASATTLNPFVFTVNTANTSTGSTAATHFKIPTVSTGTYDYYIDWGDGGSVDHITGYAQAEIDHTYSTDNTYIIKIWGTSFIGWAFDNSLDRLKMLSITRWGIFNHGSLTLEGGAFYGCSNLILTGIEDGLNYQMTYGKEFFYSCTSLTTIPFIEDWDMSLCTDLGRFFFGCTSFNEPDVDSWDVSSCISFERMFSSCSVFNQSLNSWVFSSDPITMDSMFNIASAFNGNITSWDVSSVTNIGSMFRLTSFNQNISGWDVSSNTSLFQTFESCPFNQDITGWDVSGVTSFNSTFQSNTSFNQNISGWDMSGATNTSEMFYGATSFNQNISGWDVSSVTNMSSMFRNAHAFEQDLGSWDIQNLTNATNMFSGITLNAANLDSIYNGWEANIHNSSVPFHGGSGNYTIATAGAARSSLITDGWPITDGGGI